jgi:hypothetical protein
LVERQAGLLLQILLFFVGRIRMIDMHQHPIFQYFDSGSRKASTCGTLLKTFVILFPIFDWAKMTQRSHLLLARKSTKVSRIVLGHNI